MRACGSHIKRIKRNDCDKELRHGKAFFRSFSGANAKQLRHYIIPTLVDDKSDAIVIHVGKNDILNHAKHENIAHSIINIGLDCKTNGVDEVLISSILVKKNPNLTAIVSRFNDMLRDLCGKNGFSFICNDVITTKYLWKDGVHLQDMEYQNSKRKKRKLFALNSLLLRKSGAVYLLTVLQTSQKLSFLRKFM